MRVLGGTRTPTKYRFLTIPLVYAEFHNIAAPRVFCITMNILPRRIRYDEYYEWYVPEYWLFGWHPCQVERMYDVIDGWYVDAIGYETKDEAEQHL